MCSVLVFADGLKNEVQCIFICCALVSAHDLWPMV